MSVYASNSILNVGRVVQNATALLFTPSSQAATSLMLFRERHTKHWNPKFKKLRAQKVIKVDLPNYEEKMSDLSEDEKRSRMRERGLQPPRPWMERPFFISCTGGTFEPYVPPEGDGKFSAITKTGAQQKFEFLEKKSKSMMAIRKIRRFEEDFNVSEFAEQARDIYIKAHQCLVTKNKLELRQCVTERAYPEMIHNISDKTIHWNFLESLEPARVVHARSTQIVSKDNIFSQLTVRFHTQQLLAIYDRFGRLMHGSEILKKDVLEYIVFEKHMSNEYGTWRLHQKITPSWMPVRAPGEKTYVQIKEPDSETTPEPAKPVDEVKAQVSQ